ncbi:MAG TPA: hypothetical protein VGB19_05160 [Actinomycetota bacterium]
MNGLETELRDLLRDRAALLTDVHPLSLPGRDAGHRRGGRRRAVVLALAAILVLGAGAAIAQVISSLSVTPISDRFVIASGEQGAAGSWRLTLYHAEVTVHRETTTAWCLDLDAPSVDEPGAPATEQANICREDGEPPLSEPIGATASFPGFSEEAAFVYGQVSTEVARVEIRTESGETLEATVVRAPEETHLDMGFFHAIVPGTGEFEVVARGQEDGVLDVQRMGESHRD